MNNLFSEIFGCYYKIITDIINYSPLTEEEVNKIIRQHGFEESFFHFLPNLKDIPFLKKKEGKYYSLLENKINLPLTNLEKSWLKTISEDKKFKLFDSNFNYSLLEEVLPLYNSDIFKYFDKCSDGDNFAKIQYIQNFKILNNALDNNIILKISYKATKQKEIMTRNCLPVYFEFSPKDDKLRVYAIQVFNKKAVNFVCINLEKIIKIKPSKETLSNLGEIEKYISKFNKEEKLTVEIYNQRNTIERFMIEFSTYKKQSVFNEEKQICKTSIYYKKSEETEILMKILSFGPTLKVLFPSSFIDLIREKLYKQNLLFKNKS